MATTGHRRPLAILGLAMSLALAATGCMRQPEGGSSQEHDVPLVTEGTLTVCTHLPYAPFQFQQGRKIVGFDVEIMDLVAKELGVKQDIVNTPFEGIKSGQDLNSGKCDVAAAAMTITPERQKVIDFSDGYFDARQALLTKKGQSYPDLASLNGKKVGVQGGTTGAEYTKTQKKEKGYTFSITEYEDLAAEQQALQTGQIDAAVNDLPVWTEYLKENKGAYEITAEFDTNEEYGFGVKKGNTKLVEVINSVLSEARQDGTYDKIYEKWIGRKPAS